MYIGFLGQAVRTIADQTIDGVKTFLKSPIVPTPTTSGQVANKGYVDGLITTPVGSVVNVAKYSTSTYSSGSGTIPYDDTIPQITEGTQYMALSYTPKKVGNLLKIDVVAQYACSAGGIDTCALFNGANDAIAVGGLNRGVYNFPSSFTGFMTVASLSAIPFTVRIGTNGATVYFNGNSGARYFGGVMTSSITVTEIAQ